MPFRQRDRRPGRVARTGNFIKAAGVAGVPAPQITSSGTGAVLLQFTSSNPDFGVAAVKGYVQNWSQEDHINPANVGKVLKGASVVDGRQKGSTFGLSPTYGTTLPISSFGSIK